MWLLALYVSLSFVAKHSGTIPYGDDWVSAPVHAGERTPSWSWLWELDYEWREPIPRFTIFAVNALFPHDLRAPRFLSVMLMALTAAILIRITNRQRGHTSWPDAFFPLALLHLGHTAPLLQSVFLDYVITNTLLAIIIATVADGRRRRTLTAVAGTALVALPLCGAIGVALTPALAAWFIHAGWNTSVRPNDGKQAGRLAHAIPGVLALVLLGLYFLGFRSFPDRPLGTVFDTIIGSLKMTGMSIGPAGAIAWPLGASAVAALSAATFVSLIRRRARHPEEGIRTAGFILFITSIAMAAVAIGVGRGGYHGDYIFADRYITAATPLLFGIYLSWGGPGSTGSGKLIRICLFLLMAFLFPFNARTGIGMAGTRLGFENALKSDISRGLSPAEIAARHWPFFHRSEVKFRRYLQMAKRRGFTPYGVRKVR